MLVSSAVHPATGGGSERFWTSPSDLLAAFNEGPAPQPTTWDSAVVRMEPPKLRAAGIWWSQRPRTSPLTVVTQLSPSRLEQLRSMCLTWGGPISAVVYKPVVVVVQPPQPGQRAGGGAAGTAADTAAATGHSALYGIGGADLPADAARMVARLQRRMSAFHARLDAEGGTPGGLRSSNGSSEANSLGSSACQLDLMLVWEVVDSPTTAILYPYNLLRNVAFLQVRTPLLAMVDVDFLVSRTLSLELAGPGRADFYLDMCARKALVVLPVLEVLRELSADGVARALGLAVSDKGKVGRLFTDQQALIFHHSRYQEGHGPTNYPAWLRAEPDQSDEANFLQVQWRAGYEPYFITCMGAVRWYDVRFRGYGHDKCTLTAAYHYQGFRHVVHPNAWLVHHPHNDTKSRRRYVADVQEYYHNGQDRAILDRPTSLYGRMLLLFNSSMQQLQQGTYSVALGSWFQGVRSRAPWLPPESP